MINDIQSGAVLPPVVLGVVTTSSSFDTWPPRLGKLPSEITLSKNIGNITIIDGMQRTASYITAADNSRSVLDHEIRVEFWISKNVSGFAKVTGPDRPGRRVGPAQFRSEHLIKLYLSFSLRKTNVNTKGVASKEFSRIDFVENLSDEIFQSQFYDCLEMLTRLDKAFSKYDSGDGGRFSKGRNIFDGQPSRIGFVVSVAQYVLGWPGAGRKANVRKVRMARLTKASRRLVAKLKKMPAEQVRDFLQLDVLAETLNRRVGQVGRYERAVFFEGFRVLIEENFELNDMEPCWRAE
jgi:hypothetical protein